MSDISINVIAIYDKLTEVNGRPIRPFYRTIDMCSEQPELSGEWFYTTKVKPALEGAWDTVTLDFTGYNRWMTSWASEWLWMAVQDYGPKTKDILILKHDLLDELLIKRWDRLVDQYIEGQRQKNKGH